MSFGQHHVAVLPDDVIKFAWPKPMRKQVADVGISDVGLKKLLHAHGIDTSPQGYWNRVRAGRPVLKPPKARAGTGRKRAGADR